MLINICINYFILESIPTYHLKCNQLIIIIIIIIIIILNLKSNLISLSNRLINLDHLIDVTLFYEILIHVT